MGIWDDFGGIFDFSTRGEFVLIEGLPMATIRMTFVWQDEGCTYSICCGIAYGREK